MTRFRSDQTRYFHEFRLWNIGGGPSQKQGRNESLERKESKDCKNQDVCMTKCQQREENRP